MLVLWLNLKSASVRRLLCILGQMIMVSKYYQYYLSDANWTSVSVFGAPSMCTLLVKVFLNKPTVDYLEFKPS